MSSKVPVTNCLLCTLRLLLLFYLSLYERCIVWKEGHKEVERKREREKASYPLPLINPLCCGGPVIQRPDFCPFSCWTTPFIFLLIHLCSPPLLLNAAEYSGWSSSKGQRERPLPTPQGLLSKAQTTSGMWRWTMSPSLTSAPDWLSKACSQSGCVIRLNPIKSLLCALKWENLLHPPSLALSFNLSHVVFLN